LGSNSQDEHEQRLALFIDFENIAIGVRDAHYRKFDVNLVLERLLDKGKLLVKKAYADWSRYADYKRSFHEAAIELIEVPQKSVGGKNSADIRLVVDAMDMSFQKEHINCFVVASGDSDFSPLVSKLKENNKYVIGLGVKNSTSDLLIENCDEFIFYEDLVRGQQRPVPVIANANEKQQEVFSLLVDSVLALQRENKEVLWGSMVKETMKRKKPSFNETYYGFRTFSHLLEDAQRRGIVVLRRDQKSGSYIVEDLGPGAVSSGAATVPSASAPSPATTPSPAPPALPPASASTSAPVSASTRPAETAPSATALAGEPAPGEAAAANGAARTPRRRRSRGRGRTRSTSVLAAGAFIEPGRQPGADETGDADEHEEGEGDEGDVSASEGGEETKPEGASRKSTDAAAHPAPAATGTNPDPSPEDAHRDADRGPFSFFSSWIRREPDPTTPGTGRGGSSDPER
jgi:uncharacterized LabA/DUF88 family protein